MTTMLRMPEILYSLSRNAEDSTTEIETLEGLEDMWANSPDPRSAEESYGHLRYHTERILLQHHKSLIGALRNWLNLRETPGTVVAAKLAADCHLTELRSDLFQLLEDVDRGHTKFPPGLKTYYGNLFYDYLSRV